MKTACTWNPYIYHTGTSAGFLCRYAYLNTDSMTKGMPGHARE